MHHRRDNLILFAATSALAVLLCKSKGIPLIKVPFPLIFIQLVKCDQYSQKKKKKIGERERGSSHFSHKHHRRVCTLICCLVSAYCSSSFFFFFFTFFLSFFFFEEGTLLLWQSAIYSEGFTKQSFQLWVSNKLIFVRVVLLRKEGQFYAGFYGWLHKGISLCASSLAGIADSEIIVFSNDQLQWWEKENHKLVYIVVSSGAWNIDSFTGRHLIKAAYWLCPHVQPKASSTISFISKYTSIGYSRHFSWEGSEAYLHFPGFPRKFPEILVFYLMVFSCIWDHIKL